MTARAARLAVPMMWGGMLLPRSFPIRIGTPSKKVRPAKPAWIHRTTRRPRRAAQPNYKQDFPTGNAVRVFPFVLQPEPDPPGCLPFFGQ